MAEKIENPIEGTLKDMEKSMKMKHSLVQTLEFEYKNICNKTDRNLKELEELTTNICNLEGYLNASKFRLAEYSKKETDWEKENQILKQEVDKVKKSLDESRKSAHSDDIKFDQSIIKLIEGRRKDRSLYESNTTKESLHVLEVMDRTLVEETLMVRNMLKKEKNKLPFMDSEEVTFILKNTDLSASLDLGINNLFKRKNECLKKLDDLKEKVMQLEEDINRLKKRV